MDDIKRFERIRKNIIAYYCDPVGNPEEILEKMEEDGSFRDLDYVEQNWTDWGPHRHIIRVKKLCSIFAAEENPYYQSEKLAEEIHRAIAFFLAGKYKSDNWWMNDVGVPTECGLIRLLFKEWLTEEESKEILRLAKGNPDLPREFELYSNPEKDAQRPFKSQGMHMVSQLVDTHVFLAVENGDPKVAMKKIRDCIQALNIEFKVITYPASRSKTHLYADEHCIKTDFSYHEHENEMVHNGYGLGMITYMGLLFVFWRGTDVMMDEEATREYINLLLDGFRLLRFRCTPPMMTLGRDVANADKKVYRREDITQMIISICDALLLHTDYRSDELRQWREMNANPEKCDHVTFTKYFWQSDIISHNRPGYHFSVHGVSNRIKRPESILKKNVLGMFLGDGCYNLMQTGREYDGIAPYMDWHKVPGTTVTCGDVDLNPECEIDIEIDKLRVFGGAKGTTSFVGGVSDGTYGLFAYDYNHLSVKAKKAWFCFDEGIVCLGAGICTENKDGAFTTLNQCKLFGEVMVDGEKMNHCERYLSGCGTVLSDNVGYLFLKPEKNVYLVNETRTGAWNRVDRDSGTDEPVSGQVFLLGIDHGERPENEEYAYMLLPCMDENGLLRFAEKPSVEIIENTSACQAVWHREKKQLQAVFYEAGSMKIEDFWLTVNKPCALLLQFIEQEYRIWVSNPEHETAEVVVSLSGTIKGKISFWLGEGYKLNNLGRPLCYDSIVGFLPYYGGQGEDKE